jgi:serine/threonine-protein kinase HipA
MARRGQEKALAVWVNGARVGEWRVPTRAPMEFRYAREWMASERRRPLSLSLPLTLDEVALKGAVVEAYFENLLPDSEPIRKRMQERFRTPSREPFDLLAAAGRDCVGAVQLLPLDAAPANIRRIEAEPLTETGIARVIGASISTAAANIEMDEFRITIAGAQEKTAFLKQDGRWCQPMGSTPTTHIFKLPLGQVGLMRADMSTSVENEWLCARIFAAYGMPVAHCEIDRFGEFKVLVVERFDRALHSSGKYWLRLLQEDMCQALAKPSRVKYEADGGPGVLDIARIMQGSTQRDEDLKTLFKTQLLFWMLAATDGHAKNFSIRILPAGRYRMTPLYDVLSAWPIIGTRANQLPYQKARLAMAMPGTRAHYRLYEVQRRHFETLAKKLGLKMSGDELITEVLKATPVVITEVQRGLPRGFPSQVLDSILEGLRASAEQLAR